MSEKDTEDEIAAEELTWHDYIALLFALGRTVILPFLLIAAVLFGLFLISLYFH